MTRDELLETNTALRECVEAIAALINLDFSDQEEMNTAELDEENDQLLETLSKVLDLADDAVEDDLEDQS